jgi:hypothetical protein
VPEGEPPEEAVAPLETPTAREVEARLDAEMSGRGPAKRARVAPSLGLDVQMASEPEVDRLETPCAATVDSIFSAALAETSTAGAGADGVRFARLSTPMGAACAEGGASKGVVAGWWLTMRC